MFKIELMKKKRRESCKNIVTAKQKEQSGNRNSATVSIFYFGSTKHRTELLKMKHRAPHRAPEFYEMSTAPSTAWCAPVRVRCELKHCSPLTGKSEIVPENGLPRICILRVSPKLNLKCAETRQHWSRLLFILSDLLKLFFQLKTLQNFSY